MKKILIALFFSHLAAAQVGINTTTVRADAVLDFPTSSTNTRGIILPGVSNVTTMTAVTPGTLVFDRATARIKYNNGFWRDLTDKTGVAPAILPGTDQANARVIIGSRTSAAEGVLVLESATKALVLPHVTNPVTSVKSPVAGMICYDPIKKMMAVYNGTEWFFWN